jgi:hypothetical protein
MADVTKLGDKTVIAAADIADASHPINKNAGSQANGQAGVSKVVGRLYIRDNGSDDYDIVMPLGNGSTDKWAILDGAGATVTPS